ncbi:cytochrome P450 family protein [Dictyobacter arantiisoli]|uniref:Polyketide biosynthesis cytochrome P450 PksS n=1 Tax=Dictyobacter arantiisoli TaxID=2014874 RepID=A0A5A5TFZ3_9CHLR|nr:cytochrome P450 [Dictyobacter arantiisoli]GCF09983.1 polyketide biosynthesis cytochrome P450 PksS [Dictyobacter arantiisoli]
MTPISLNDLFLQETLRDPIAFYGRLREQEVLSHFTTGETGVWIIATTYAESIELLKDARLINDRSRIAVPGTPPPVVGRALAAFSQNLLGVDPPDHTRLRKLVSKAFTPHMIEQLRPRIQQITDELLDAVQETGTMDLIADFAFPLPLTVIAEMLGIPISERQQFRAWTQALLASLTSPQHEEAGVAAAEAFISSINTLLASKRRHPGADLTSDLLRAEEQGDMLSENELITMIWQLVVGGHETTVNLLGDGMLALLQHPEQMSLLQHNPDLLSSTVEELLRHTAPVLFAAVRWASEDIPLHGQVIRKGEMVRISLCAANTDPQQFSDPTVLDITRQVNQHLAFGRGIHYCLGAPLARLEGQIALGTLLRRFPHLHLACQPEQLEWNPFPYLRGLKALPVQF